MVSSRATADTNSVGAVSVYDTRYAIMRAVGKEERPSFPPTCLIKSWASPTERERAPPLRSNEPQLWRLYENKSDWPSRPQPAIFTQPFGRLCRRYNVSKLISTLTSSGSWLRCGGGARGKHLFSRGSLPLRDGPALAIQ